MKKFTKITVGFVAQSYEKNTVGKSVCTAQEFIAGSSVDYEDSNGNTISVPEYDYQPFNMSLLNGEELQRARDIIDRYNNMAARSDKFLSECFIYEQCSDIPRKKISVRIMVESGKLWIQPAGFGDKTSVDGHGWPIGLEIWQGRLRLIIFDDINTEDPQIIDLEKAREDGRSD